MARGSRSEEAEGDLGMIGRSPAIQALRRQIARVAPTVATVLIRGERGTGKELVARALHTQSRRSVGPFIAVNCAALPPALLASELFGHERGAFTGAVERRQGFVQAAEGGTLFVDEIGDLSGEGQAILLRFLEDWEVQTLGRSRSARADVRVVAATNTDLEAAMERREFRPDLYERLDEVMIAVPPLRERREDIPLLVDHFMARYADAHGRTIHGLTGEALRALRLHVWPGNVRELEKAISRGVINAEGGWIRPADLQLRGLATAPVVRRPADGEPEFTLRQREALRLATACGVVRRADLTARFGVSGEAVRRDLVGLVAAGLLRRERLRGLVFYVPAAADEILRGGGPVPAPPSPILTDRNSDATPPQLA